MKRHSCEWRSGATLRRGFTLLELLVATVVFALILVLTFSVISQTSSVWQRSTRDLEAFQNARLVFENLTRLASQATLNTYWDYEINGVGQVVRYRRNSDLHFYLAAAGLNGVPGTSGCGQALFFQAPYSRRAPSATWVPQLLNEIGFYVEFGSDDNWLPTALKGSLTASWRYRLFQAVEPAEDLTIYSTSAAQADPPPWVSTGNAHPVADNIVALVVLPGRAEAEEALLGPLVTNLAYDSRTGATLPVQPVSANQLPPLLNLAMIAIDEKSAARLASGSTPPAQVGAALAGRFQLAANFQEDLKDAEADLTAAGVSCRVFSTRILLKESKWSE
ncbi:MAG: prepilin-type N-terminal cleavage/methylation domain-containing protein [Chthoniobacterales bacterium]|nr:prepilin-type N-terminal cleavage/methylation domain-containing protein [Chthoniobacterales bacterium]